MTEPSDENDVKALLGRALSGEPPLTLDRDEVFRQGRRKLRIRRMFSTGGAIGGAVVAVVGAVMLTGLIADEPAPEETPPAASPTALPAPPGPTLPLSTTEVAPTRLSAPPSQHHANTLTADFFARNDALPDTAQTFRPDGKTARFTVAKDTYELRVDVRLPDAEGALTVSIGAADPKRVAGCGDLPDAKYGCTVRAARGIHVAVGTWKDYGTGEKRYIAFAVHPDGTSVTAIATNLPDAKRKGGLRPTDRTPVFGQDVMAKLVTMPALRYAG
jgi:hypothetical protein